MERNTIHLGDCLELMPQIKTGSIDMILCDLPYGTTACKWDSIIHLGRLWEQYRRITKPNAAIVLTASQPFTTTLISSNFKDFKYEWIWNKSRSTGFLQSSYMPMKSHESVLVFCKEGIPTYNPQKTKGHKPTSSALGYGHSPTFGKCKPRKYQGGDTTRNPKSVISFNNERGLHPTQKPETLMGYLIKTYTDEGELILDNCSGSGTTGAAAKKLKRDFILMEKDPLFFTISEERIFSPQLDLFLK